MTYPAAYHAACRHLIAFGGHGGDTTRGRKLCADALRALRRDYGSARARRERHHLLFISGQFPVKAAPACPYTPAEIDYARASGLEYLPGSLYWDTRKGQDDLEILHWLEKNGDTQS